MRLTQPMINSPIGGSVQLKECSSLDVRLFSSPLPHWLCTLQTDELTFDFQLSSEGHNRSMSNSGLDWRLSPLDRGTRSQRKTRKVSLTCLKLHPHLFLCGCMCHTLDSQEHGFQLCAEAVAVVGWGSTGGDGGAWGEQIQHREPRGCAEGKFAHEVPARGAFLARFLSLHSLLPLSHPLFRFRSFSLASSHSSFRVLILLHYAPAFPSPRIHPTRCYPSTQQPFRAHTLCSRSLSLLSPHLKHTI